MSFGTIGQCKENLILRKKKKLYRLRITLVELPFSHIYSEVSVRKGKIRSNENTHGNKVQNFYLCV